MSETLVRLLNGLRDAAGGRRAAPAPGPVGGSPLRAGAVAVARRATLAPPRRAQGPDEQTLICVALLLVFAIQLMIVLPLHEPWYDEAQAWLLARDASFRELLDNLLRYEGTPGLWHLLLMVPAKLGLPYASMQWIAALAALAAAALLALRSPFPLWAKAGLLLSFPIAYQYAAIARSYVLLAPLLFGLALLHPRRWRLLPAYAALLATLALTSLHGMLIAAGIAAEAALETYGVWGKLDDEERRRRLTAAAVLGLLALLTAAVLWPPDDLAGNVVTRTEGIAGLLDIPHYLDRALASQALLTLVTLAASVVVFRRTGTVALWLLATVPLLLLSALRYHAPHHDTIPMLVWVYALWVALQHDHRRGLPADRLVPALVGVALVPVLLVQVPAWAGAWRYDVTAPYSGSRAVGVYLAGVQGEVVGFSDWGNLTSVMPYLDRNPFSNYRGGQLPAYWSHHHTPLDGRRELIAERAPQVVVFGAMTQEQMAAVPRELPGYREVGRFTGFPRRRDAGDAGQDSFVVFERVP